MEQVAFSGGQSGSECVEYSFRELNVSLFKAYSVIFASYTRA